MTTRVFNSFEEFKNRIKKSVNGVSRQFALANPDYAIKNKTNNGCWNCADSFKCSDCVDCDNCFCCVECENSSGLVDKYKHNNKKHNNFCAKEAIFF